MSSSLNFSSNLVFKGPKYSPALPNHVKMELSAKFPINNPTSTTYHTGKLTISFPPPAKMPPPPEQILYIISVVNDTTGTTILTANKGDPITSAGMNASYSFSVPPGKTWIYLTVPEHAKSPAIFSSCKITA